MIFKVNQNIFYLSSLGNSLSHCLGNSKSSYLGKEKCVPRSHPLLHSSLSFVSGFPQTLRSDNNEISK